MKMGTTKTEGRVRELAGDAQEAVGELLGDASTRLSGKAKALCGKSQQLATDAAVVTRETIADNPLATVGIAVGIGFALGALWGASRE
ncbi:CsbD family protein [Paraburkholderia sp. BR14263]|uniref:glycine zipper domain-containing protein n=1 Tax=unclassified Paraburkholderia TaxID=2615204 RepID=UPI0034CE1D13